MNIIKLISGCALMLLATLGLADNHNRAAFVNPSAGLCAAYDDTGAYWFTDDTRIVSTQSATGATQIKCTFQVNPTVSGRAYVESGFLCAMTSEFYGLVFSESSSNHKRQTPKGSLVLTCHFNDL